MKSPLWESSSFHSTRSNAGRRSREEGRRGRKEVAYLARSEKLTLAGGGLKDILLSLPSVKHNMMIVISQNYNICNYKKVLEISY